MAHAFDPATADWNLLRAFGAVLEHGSLTRAAERLGSSQPTLSRQIAALEALVGAPLFERTARRLKPTQQGQALAEPASRMLAAAQAMAVVAAEQGESLAGSVRLTASDVVSAHVLPRLLVRLAQALPEVQVELVSSNRLDNLLEREADIAIRMVRPAQGTVITRHLADWPLGLYAHTDYLRQVGGTIDATRLADYRWIGLDQEMAFIDGFRAAGQVVDRRFFSFRCDNQSVGLQALLAGLGIGVAITPWAGHRPQLQRVLPGLPMPSLPVWLTAHRELRSSRRLRAVFDLLASELQREDALA